MALNVLGLGMLFTAKDQASGVISGLGGRFGDLEKQVGASKLNRNLLAIGGGLVALGAGAAVAGGALHLAEAAKKFEFSLAGIRAATGFGRADLELLREAALDASQATGFAPTQAVEGLAALAKAGLSARKSIEALGPALDLAVASQGKLGIEAAAETLPQLNSFRGGMDNLRGSVDRLVTSAGTFTFNIEDIPLALGRMARGAATVNATLDDSLIAFGLAKGALGSVERSATAVSSALLALVRPETQERLAALGQGVQAVSEGRLRPLVDVAVDLERELRGFSEAEQAAFLQATFGEDAMGAMATILGSLRKGVTLASGEMVRGAEAIEKLREGLTRSGGAAAEFREAMLDTLAGQERLLTNSVLILETVLGEPLAEVLKPLVRGVVEIVDGLTNAFRGLAPETRRTISLAVALAGPFLAVGGALTVLGGLAPLIGTSLGAMLASTLAAALPVAGVLAGLGAAALGIKVAWERNFGGIREIVFGTFERLSVAGTTLFQHFTRGFIDVELADKLESAGFEGTKGFVLGIAGLPLAFGKLASAIGEAFEEVAPTFKAIFLEVGNILDTALSPALRSATDGALGLWDAMAKIDAGQLTISILSGIATALAEVTLLTRGIIANFEEFGLSIPFRLAQAREGIISFAVEAKRFVGIEDPLAVRQLNEAIIERLRLEEGLRGVQERNAETLGRLEVLRGEAGARFVGSSFRAFGGLPPGAASITPSVPTTPGGAGLLPPAPEIPAGVRGFEPGPRRGFEGETVGMVTAPILLEVDGRTLAEVVARAQVRLARRTDFAFGGLA